MPVARQPVWPAPFILSNNQLHGGFALMANRHSRRYDSDHHPIKPKPHFFTWTNYGSFRDDLSKPLSSNFPIVWMHEIEN